MTPADAARVLAACALFDNRKVQGEEGKQLAKAWFAVIGDLALEDALEAVRRHYRDSTEWMMPAHVRRGVRAINEERRRNQPHEVRALPSAFEQSVDRQVRKDNGIGAARSALVQVFEVMATRSGSPAAMAALEELRERTAGPGWEDEEQEGGMRK